MEKKEILKEKPSFIRIDAESKRKLQHIAVDKGVPFYVMVNEAIEFYLSKN